MQVCKNIKCYCTKHEWAATTFLLLGAAIFVGTIWAAIDLQLVFLAWLKQNVLLNTLLFASAVLFDVLLMFGLLCFGFSECSREGDHKKHTYHGRRTPHHPAFLNWVDTLGKNPRRQPRKSQAS